METNIKQMAEQCGVKLIPVCGTFPMYGSQLEAFARLIAADCASICDGIQECCGRPQAFQTGEGWQMDCCGHPNLHSAPDHAATIRARYKVE
jgi:hypothetical protein